jgi:2-polyprenyl-3-methyl-5-hydroxy-6-metoxy-1,4-benzoquinol methylase
MWLHPRARARKALEGFKILIHFRQSQAKITRDAQRYWNNTSGNDYASNSHWRGQRGLRDEVWSAIGKGHLDLFERFLRLTDLGPPFQRIIEWGCGGGANAIQFAKLTSEFIGVDISQASLEECAKVLAAEGCDHFQPVLMEVDDPESVLERVAGPCDVFLCLYVFEVLPSPAYGKRLLEIALKLLRLGGVAMIQMKYQTHEARTRSRGWGYRTQLCSMTSYPIDRFWELTQEVGFTPLAVHLVPIEPLVHDERYAYFLLRR